MSENLCFLYLLINLPAVHCFPSFALPVLQAQTGHTLQLFQMHSTLGSSEEGGLVARSLIMASVSEDFTNKELRCRMVSLCQDQGQKQWSGWTENLQREMRGRPSPLAFSTTVLTREVADLGLRQLNWTQPTKLLECGCVLDSTFRGSDARRERFSHLRLKQEAFW